MNATRGTASHHNIPIVDLDIWISGNDAARRALAAEVGDICHQQGFFYLINHGISGQFIDHYLDYLRSFFDLSNEQKQAIDKIHSPHFRGWERTGSELTNNKIDYREQLDIGPERLAITNPDPYYLRLVGPNQWPSEEQLPGFQQCVLSFIAKLSEAAKILLNIMSVALRLEPNHIQTVFGEEPSPYLKLIRYPPTPESYQGVGAHKDSGYLTLLLQDEIAGLEAQATDGRWYEIPPLANSLVVNIGELMQLITHNYFIATPHRVTNNHSQPRFSSAFFYSPDLSASLNPLPISNDLITKARRSDYHRNAGLMASQKEMSQGVGGMNSKIQPKIFGFKYWERWVRSYPEIATRYYPNG